MLTVINLYNPLYLAIYSGSTVLIVIHTLTSCFVAYRNTNTNSLRFPKETKVINSQSIDTRLEDKAKLSLTDASSAVIPEASDCTWLYLHLFNHSHSQWDLPSPNFSYLIKDSKTSLGFLIQVIDKTKFFTFKTTWNDVVLVQFW